MTIFTPTFLFDGHQDRINLIWRWLGRSLLYTCFCQCPLVVPVLLASLSLFWGVTIPVPAIAQQSSTRLPSRSDLPPSLADIHPLQSMPRVAELSDIDSDDWAFQALQSLVERYNCLSTPSSRPSLEEQYTMSRRKFAAILNACLQRLEQRKASQMSKGLDPVSQDSIQHLQSDFSRELISLQQRLDTIDTQMTKVETQQFAPMTQLSGEVIFALAGVVGGKRIDNEEESIDTKVSLAHRVRLNFDTTFTGQDQLRIRLQARNIPEFENVTGTPMANLSFDGADGNGLKLADLSYQFLIGQQRAWWLV